MSTVWTLGCGGDTEEDVDVDLGASEAVDRGWTDYATGDFASALTNFEEAASLDSGLADAHNGVGWSRLSLVDGTASQPTLSAAVDAFGRALQGDSAHADAWVGLGQALLLRRSGASDISDAAKAFTNARTANVTTLFRHDYTSIAEIRAAEAWSQYYAGDTASARMNADEAVDAVPGLAAAEVLLTLTQ